MSDLVEKQNENRNHVGRYTTPTKAVPSKMFRLFLEELIQKYGNVTLGYLLSMYNRMSKEEQFNFDAAGNYYVDNNNDGVLDELFKAALRGNIDVYTLMKFQDTMELKRIQDYLKEKLPYPWVSWEDIDDMHITLTYSTNVSAMEAAEVAIIVANDFSTPFISQGTAPTSVTEPQIAKSPIKVGDIPITVDGGTIFNPSNGSSGRYVIVLNIRKVPELMALQQRLFEMTSALMLQSSEYSVPGAWNPHITLAYSEEPIDSQLLDIVGGFTLKPSKLDVSVDRQVIGSTDNPSNVIEGPSQGNADAMNAEDFYESQGIS